MFGIDGKQTENFPSFGSFKTVSIVKGIHKYVGLSTDISKLPTYVGSGSIAKCVDTGDTYMFEETTKTWYKQPKSIPDIYVEGSKLIVES